MPERRISAALASRWWYPGLGALLAGASLINAAALHRAPSALSIVVALAAGLVVAGCSRFRVGAPLAVAALCAVRVVPGLTDAAPDLSFVAPAVAAYVVAAHAGHLIAAGTLVLLTASLEIVGLPAGVWVPELYLLMGPWVVGRIVRSRGRVVAQLERRTVELERERGTFAHLAAQRERGRIARELHDIVSHNMAVMVVQAGAGRVAPPEDPERVAQIFRGIRAAGDAALAEMDQLVDVLSLHPGGDRGTTLSGVADLVAQARAAGLNITAEVSVKSGRIPVQVEQAAYRAIQEGLTNVLKHAPASSVRLRIVAGEQELEIDVRNSSTPVDGSGLVQTGSGLGLIGMSERVRGSGGELSAGPLPHGGWHVIVRLPTHSAE